MKNKAKRTSPKLPAVTPQSKDGDCGCGGAKSGVRVLTNIPTPTADCCWDSGAQQYNLEVKIDPLGLATNENHDVVVRAEVWTFPVGSTPAYQDDMDPDPATGGYIKSFVVNGPETYFAKVIASWTIHNPGGDTQQSGLTTCQENDPC